MIYYKTLQSTSYRCCTHTVKTMYRTAAQTSEANAKAMEDEWKTRPFWVLDDEAYSRIMEKLHNGGSEGEWSYLNICPHAGPDRKDQCTCPKMLNVKHQEWGMCRIVNGLARPVIPKSDFMTLGSLPVRIY